MKRYLLAAGLALGALAVATAASAGDCTLHIKRTACPGHETESYSKCDGKAECDQPDPAATADACSKAAADACPNTRPTITKWKTVSASFKGAALPGGHDADGAASAGGPNFCPAVAPQCQ